jgi:hypothetical protein
MSNPRPCDDFDLGGAFGASGKACNESCTFVIAAAGRVSGNRPSADAPTSAGLALREKQLIEHRSVLDSSLNIIYSNHATSQSQLSAVILTFQFDFVRTPYL